VLGGIPGDEEDPAGTPEVRRRLLKAEGRDRSIEISSEERETDLERD
jgi:hypothetical protein